MADLVKQVCNMEDFEKHLENAGDKLVVVDFYAVWCGPCKMIAPKVQGMAKQFEDTVIFLKVDVDECEDVAEKQNISAMPTFIFFKDGKKVDEVMGANHTKLQECIDKHTQQQGTL